MLTFEKNAKVLQILLWRTYWEPWECWFPALRHYDESAPKFVIYVVSSRRMPNIQQKKKDASPIQIGESWECSNNILRHLITPFFTKEKKQKNTAKKNLPKNPDPSLE